MERIEVKSLSQQQILPKLRHGDSIVQLGSCFSTHMTTWFRQAGFAVLDNPLGVVFHPLALAEQIKLACAKERSFRFVWKEDVCLAYEASSHVYALSEEELEKLLNNRLDQLRDELLQARFLFVTWGSAHAYRLQEDGQLVANCHQQPAPCFTKELTSSQTISSTWNEVIALLKEVNPQLELVFTVSPIRYIRDGLLENTRSKAALFQALDQLDLSTFYFPAYELVNDVLRDYSYFERDGVHPNQQAVDFVWNFLRTELIDEQCNQVIDDLLELRRMEGHRLLYPESKQAEKYLESVKRKRESFLSLHPLVIY